MKHFQKLLTSLLFISFTTVVSAQDQQPMIGQPAPLFQLKALDGKTYSLEQLKGRYVVVHFATLESHH